MAKKIFPNLFLMIASFNFKIGKLNLFCFTTNIFKFLCLFSKFTIFSASCNETAIGFSIIILFFLFIILIAIFACDPLSVKIVAISKFEWFKA